MSHARATRPWAWPLVPLYRAGQLAENWLRARGATPTRELDWPVVSVGSLSAGGAGKTPVVIALVEMLRAAHWHADVLTRGYGRTGSGVAQVPRLEQATAAWLQMDGDEMEQRLAALQTTGRETTAADERARPSLLDPLASQMGDEPVLIAARTGAPVWVAADRHAAGLAAERAVNAAEFDPAVAAHRAALADRCMHILDRRVHILDDGFQHRHLARRFDVVLVTAADFDDAPLPAGNLREPLAALRRADAVVVRDDEIAELKPKLWPLLRAGAQVWTVHRRLRFPAPLGVLTAGLRPLAFCSIARPDGFAAALLAAGCGVVDTVVFRDHQPLHAPQLREIVAFAKQLNASGLVTTEKDFVKLSGEALGRLRREVGPMCVAALDAEFADPAPIVAALGSRLLA